MKTHFSLRPAAIACGIALLSIPAIASATEATFERTLNVGGNVSLSVSTGSGSIHLSPGSDNQVHIVGHVKSNNGSSWFGGGSSEDRVKQIVADPPIEQSGNDVRIGKKNSDWQRHVSIDYEITAPRSATVDAGSGSGDLRIRDFTGGLKASTGSGSIEATAIGGAVSLDTGSGDIQANLNNPASTKAETGSGTIRLTGVKGRLKAHTGSGDISIQGSPTAEWKLETGSGSVDLATGGAKFTLDASTGSGTIHSDPPISTHGNFEKHHIAGDVNGGGPLVTIETGSGDIEIK